MPDLGSGLKWFMVFSAAVLIVCPLTARGQPSLVHETDTLTAGDSDERNPSLQRNGFFGPPTQWLVFERTTAGMTSICGIQLENQARVWRPDVVQISGLHPAGLVRFPDVAGTEYSPIPFRVIAWEQLTSSHWNIYYSTRSDADLAWSDPRALTEDTLDNTGVQLRPLAEGYVLATWRKGKDFVCSSLGYEGRIETFFIGTSTLDGFEFDVNTQSYSGNSFVWVAQDSLGKRVIAIRSMRFDYFGQPKWEPTQLVAYPFSVHNPWLVTENPPGLPVVAFEVRTDQRTEVFVATGQSIDNVTADTSADYGHPTGIFISIVTSRRAKGTLQREASYLADVFVVERRGRADSSLVFWPGDSAYSDTLKGPGANRNVIVGSPQIYVAPSAWYPVVWESNRTGRWHLYGAFVLLSTGDVPNDLTVPTGFSLAQNYPNPFNPTTKIQFTIVNRQLTIVKVYDVLGSEVATLVNEVKEPGTYTVQFNGSNLASGVYFYRLHAGEFTQTKRLMSLK